MIPKDENPEKPYPLARLVDNRPGTVPMLTTPADLGADRVDAAPTILSTGLTAYAHHLRPAVRCRLIVNTGQPKARSALMTIRPSANRTCAACATPARHRSHWFGLSRPAALGQRNGATAIPPRGSHDP